MKRASVIMKGQGAYGARFLARLESTFQVELDDAVSKVQLGSELEVVTKLGAQYERDLCYGSV